MIFFIVLSEVYDLLSCPPSDSILGSFMTKSNKLPIIAVRRAAFLEKIQYISAHHDPKAPKPPSVQILIHIVYRR